MITYNSQCGLFNDPQPEPGSMVLVKVEHHPCQCGQGGCSVAVHTYEEENDTIKWYRINNPETLHQNGVE